VFACLQLPTALVALAVDPELQSCRYRLVRKKFTDEMFWRSYAYQVERIRAATPGPTPSTTAAGGAAAGAGGGSGGAASVVRNLASDGVTAATASKE
jgi:hypothetical protein